MSLKLYELAEAYNNVINMMEDEEMDSEGLQKALETINEDIEKKVENIARVVKNYEGNISIIREEEKRLASKRRALSNNIDSLKGYTESILESANIDRVQGDLFTVALQNNPQSVKFIDEDLIPVEYKEEVVTVKIPKKRILDDIKEGIEVPGVEVVQTKSLRIR